MNNLTLVIPAKYEAGTLPIVLKELEKYKGINNKCIEYNAQNKMCRRQDYA